MLRKLTVLILVLSMLFATFSTLTSCSVPGDQDPEDDGGAPKPKPDPKDPVIVVPEYKDYGRGTVNFSDLSYTRPDFAKVRAAFASVTEKIQKNLGSFEEQLAGIKALESDYSDLVSMYTLAEINSYKNTGDTFWASEFEYVSTNYPSFAKAVEDMMVAAAQSVNAERFESDYFGEGLIEKYAGGGKLTDEAVLLEKEEAALEADFSAISTATVEISYDGESGTVDELLARAAEQYGTDSRKYLALKTMYLLLYNERAEELTKPIFVELIKVRRKIADAMGYDSYAEYAYGAMGHDYSPADMQKFLGNIKTYVWPVYSNLYSYVFGSYFNSNSDFALDKITALNTLYEVYGKMDSDIFSIYSYMLQHGLYDVSDGSERFPGAFTTYIDSNASPYLFVTNSGYGKDYLTLSHEFGHFIDGYVNFNSSTSLDLSEVSSQGFEFLSLLALEDELDPEDYQYILYHSLRRALDTLLYQGFLAAFEHIVYGMDYDDIDEESVTRAVKDASMMIFGSEVFTDISEVTVTHTMIYPFYVQSYCTSIVPALEIFFAESEDGEGLEIYKNLVSRESDGLTFVEHLTLAGLSSPFDSEVLMDVCNGIHERVLGSVYFKEQGSLPDAA